MTAKRFLPFTLSAVVLLAGLLGCSPSEHSGKEFVYVGVMRDPAMDLDPWILSAIGAFEAKRMRTSDGRQVLVSTVETRFDRMRESLGWLPPRIEIVILNSSFEKHAYPELESQIPRVQLGHSALVLATSDKKAAQQIASLGYSVSSLLEVASKGRIRIAQPEPSQDSVGLAALILEGYSFGALPRDGGAVIDQKAVQLFRLLKKTAVFPDFSVEPQVGQWDVALMSDIRCSDLIERGHSIEATYPKEGTLLLDYPLFIPDWVEGDEKEAAEMFLDFLESSEMQAQKNSLLGKNMCAVDKGPPQFLDPPGPAVVRKMLDAWSAVDKGAP